MLLHTKSNTKTSKNKKLNNKLSKKLSYNIFTNKDIINTKVTKIKLENIV